LSEAVLITGAASGIGRACALLLDKLNFQVYAGVRDAEEGSYLKRESSERLTPISLDIVNDESIRKAVKTVTSDLGESRLSGLVNNAGITLHGPLEFISRAAFRSVLEVNVLGQLAVTQAFLPLLRETRGRIVNIGSVNGKIASAFKGPYCASKFALEALTDALRMELRPWGIEVCIVQPGSVSTPMWQKIMAAEEDLEKNLPEEGKSLYGQALRKRHQYTHQQAKSAIPAEKVASVVAHALTVGRPKARYIVGTKTKIAFLIAKFMPDRLRDNLISARRGRTTG
jgi:NAD(P)-dependent dehydrogenase (short-subunit alcohol dehydrogenase family)